MVYVRMKYAESALLNSPKTRKQLYKFFSQHQDIETKRSEELFQPVVKIFMRFRLRVTRSELQKAICRRLVLMQVPFALASQVNSTSSKNPSIHLSGGRCVFISNKSVARAEIGLMIAEYEISRS
jgi:hypothetical protein